MTKFKSESRPKITYPYLDPRAQIELKSLSDITLLFEPNQKKIKITKSKTSSNSTKTKAQN